MASKEKQPPTRPATTARSGAENFANVTASQQQDQDSRNLVGRKKNKRRFRASVLKGERGVSLEFGKFVALISVSGKKSNQVPDGQKVQILSVIEILEG